MTIEPLLEVSRLRVAFDSFGARTVAVRGVDFDIRRGETVALVGESGSGKTASALALLRLLPANAEIGGSVSFHCKRTGSRRDLLAMPPDALRALRGDRIAMIFQEPMVALNPLHRVGRQIVESLLLHGDLTRTEARRQATAALDRVGLENPERRLEDYPHQLSGGQRQRVMIAAALANDPDLLIADEPTTALDVGVQAQILDLLVDLRRETGMSLLLITHDLGIVRKMADRVCVMHGGDIVERAATQSLFSSPQDRRTLDLLRSDPPPLPPRPPGERAILQVRDLRVWFPIQRGIFRRTIGHVKAVDGVDIALCEGRSLGVVGESGSGKTSLARALLRLISSRGEIRFRDRRLDGLNQRRTRPLRRYFQIVFQDPFSSLNPRLSASRIIDEGLAVLYPELDEEAKRKRVTEALIRVGLDPEMQDRYPHEFSGGQRQRIAIARALVLNPILLVLDEPTSALDASVQVRVIDLLRDLQSDLGMAYIVISHDLRVIRALADDVAVMKDGVFVETGPAERLFSRPEADYTKAMMAAAYDLKAPPLA